MRHDDGFTQIEALVAFAILAMALTAIFQSFGNSLTATAMARRERQAVDLGRTLVAQTGTVGPFDLAAMSGHEPETGIYWKRTMVPLAGNKAGASPIWPHLISVTLSFLGANGKTQKIELSTIKLSHRGQSSSRP